MTTLDDLPAHAAASKVAKRLGVSVDTLRAMSDRKEFPRYYLFGKRAFYRIDDILKELPRLPGDPDQWERHLDQVEWQVDPIRARRARRSTVRTARGSSAPSA